MSKQKMEKTKSIKWRGWCSLDVGEKMRRASEVGGYLYDALQQVDGSTALAIAYARLGQTHP
jgi:hypothetical protein